MKSQEFFQLLRDFSAVCLAEFVKWSIKQQGAKKGALNVNSLLQGLFSLTSHSNPRKRLGACLTFGRIYRNLREEPRLISRFCLEICYQLLLSISIAERSPNKIDTV